MMTPMQVQEELNREMGKRLPYGMGGLFSWLPTTPGAKRISKHKGGYTPPKRDARREKAKRKAAAKMRAYTRRKGC